jgi:hypothetical protein
VLFWTEKIQKAQKHTAWAGTIAIILHKKHYYTRDVNHGSTDSTAIKALLLYGRKAYLLVLATVLLSGQTFAFMNVVEELVWILSRVHHVVSRLCEQQQLSSNIASERPSHFDTSLYPCSIPIDVEFMIYS